MPMANPHSVNHVVVEFLGEEEVVLCACDDGDVVGYYVRDLWREVEAAGERKIEEENERQVRERDLVAEEKRARRDEERLRREALGMAEEQVGEEEDGEMAPRLAKRFRSFEDLRTQLRPPATGSFIKPQRRPPDAADAYRSRPQHAPLDEDPLARASRLTREHDDLEAERQQPDAERPKPQIRPCFHENARLSAWGLAVHSEARLIAVSSNTTRITVWAVALIQAPKLSDEDDKQDKLILQDTVKGTGFTYRAISHQFLCRRLEEPEEGVTAPEMTYAYKFKAQMSMSSLREVRDQERSLKGHSTNIPAIAFCNVPGDSSGKYLASTDIDGTTMVWDVDRGIPVRLMRPSRMMEEHRMAADYDNSRDGWGITFLDPRAFKPTKSVVEAMGTCSSMCKVIVSRGANMPVLQEPRKRKIIVWDTSESQCMVKNAGAWDLQGLRAKRTMRQQNHPYVGQHSQGPEGTSGEDPDTNDATLVEQVMAIAAAHAAGDEGATTHMQGEDEMTALLNEDDDLSDTEPSTSVLEASLASDASTPLLSPPDTPNKRPMTLAKATYRNNLAGKIPSDTISSSIDPLELRGSRWPLFTYDSYHAGHADLPDLASPFIPSAEEMPNAPIALLNPRAIHLFQSPSLLNPPNGVPRTAPGKGLSPLPPAYDTFADRMLHPTEPPDPGPTIFIDDPLAQSVDSIASVLNGHDRMNLTAQIPELGVFLVGSPKGRVGVFTLHTLMPDHTKQLNDVQEEVKTMRLDWLLPFKSQEEEEMRPLQQLVGLSVGPVFRTGSENRAGESGKHREWIDRGARDGHGEGDGVADQRAEKVDGVWRILLLYRNHTILAYEIRRPGFGVLDDPHTGISCRG